jgi:anhydro-N-acetylmuramic acid kinase
MAQEPNLFIGMLSGTSRDGVDTVLVRFGESIPEIVATLCVTYPQGLAETLRKMVDRRRRPDNDDLSRVDAELAEFFALAAWGLMDKAGVDSSSVTAVGSHGQTVWHQPQGDMPETIQLGNPQQISNLLGISTVADFRQADLKAGGQGAPLAPLIHSAYLKPQTGIRVVANIGGIANISILGSDGVQAGYDTGPGNCLLDAWVRKHQGSDYDEGGKWAATGMPDQNLIDLLMADPYFSMPAPKSTGVEYFNSYWLQNRLDERSADAMQASLSDIQASLSELTARTIVKDTLEAGANELLICGGGARNLDLLDRICRLLPDTLVDTTASRGLDPDWVEGILFAWLARERLAGREQETRKITGASQAILLGDVFQPQ